MTESMMTNTSVSGVEVSPVSSRRATYRVLVADSSQPTSLLGLPKELKYLVGHHLHDDARTFSQSHVKDLRPVNRELKDIADEILQARVTVDMDLFALYPSFPLTRLKKGGTIQELTINKTQPTQVDRDIRSSLMLAGGSKILPTEEEIEDTLVEALKGSNILTCHILYQNPEATYSRSYLPLNTCRMGRKIDCRTLLQVISCGRDHTIDGFLVKRRENGRATSYVESLNGMSTDTSAMTEVFGGIVSQAESCTWVTHETVNGHEDGHEASDSLSTLGPFHQAQAIEQVGTYVLENLLKTDQGTGEDTALRLTHRYLMFCSTANFDRTRPGKILAKHLREKTETRYEEQSREEDEMMENRRADRRSAMRAVRVGYMGDMVSHHDWYEEELDWGYHASRPTS